MQRLSKAILTGIAYLSAAMLAYLLAIIFINIVLRYGFNSSIVTTEEISRFLFIWIVFLGVILAAHEHKHVVVNLVVDRLPATPRRVLDVVVQALILGISCLIAWGSWHHIVINRANVAPITFIPYSFLYLPIFLAAVGSGIVAAHDLYRLLASGKAAK